MLLGGPSEYYTGNVALYPPKERGRADERMLIATIHRQRRVEQASRTIPRCRCLSLQSLTRCRCTTGPKLSRLLRNTFGAVVSENFGIVSQTWPSRDDAPDGIGRCRPAEERTWTSLPCCNATRSFDNAGHRLWRTRTAPPYSSSPFQFAACLR